MSNQHLTGSGKEETIRRWFRYCLAEGAGFSDYTKIAFKVNGYMDIN
jgi:hypothetical protein